jgi:hypothetical protein
MVINMKMLVFESGRLSYDSSRCFAQMICRGLEKCGVQVETFLLEEDLASQEEQLKELARHHFDGVLDINSRLPNVLLDERYYPDYFDAPFFQLIVDHPMHLHQSLQIPLKQYRVICLDRYHRKYIEKYYPHIEKVYVMPFGGIAQEEFSGKKERVLPMEKRPYHILFPGTYTPLWYYREQMEMVSDSQWEICTRVLRKYQQGQEGFLEDFFREEVKEDEEFFPLMMHKARLIDKYVREWYREAVLKALLHRGLTIDVMGFRWEMFSKTTPGQLRIHQPGSYSRQLETLGKSCMTLNVQPLFRDGVHDRVMNAMANRSVALTDSCDFLERYFSPGKDLVFFEKNHLEETAEKVADLLNETDTLEEMAESAYHTFSSAHTWYHRVEKFLAQL